jgi:hypothetical protein
MPGASVSVTGTPASIRSGALPGATIPNLFSGIPRLLNALTATSASSRDLKTPVTACIIQSSRFERSTDFFKATDIPQQAEKADDTNR